jgi:hypothetical protein
MTTSRAISITLPVKEDKSVQRQALKVQPISAWLP